MSNLARVLNSSLGRKYVMALSGGFLILFLLEHLYTNVKLYYGDGGEAFNKASDEMVHTLLIRIIEVVLFAAIVIHAIQALALTSQNRKARPIKYAVNKTNETSSWFSRNMMLTGSIVFFFIVVHLYNFFVPYRVTGHVAYNDPNKETLAHEVTEALGNPVYAVIYLVSVVFLAFHLNHALQSALQSLGFNNKKYAPLLRKTSTGLAILMLVGFGSFPVIFYLGEVLGYDILTWSKR
jgi:succinate dehydrogenase / fumarate reductase, cytochrome b subunit